MDKSKFKAGDWLTREDNSLFQLTEDHLKCNDITIFNYKLWEPEHDEIICLITAEGSVVLGRFKGELSDGEYVGMHLDGIHPIYIDDIAPLEFAITLRRE